MYDARSLVLVFREKEALAARKIPSSSQSRRSQNVNRTRRNGTGEELHVYNRVRALRRERGLSQKKLAEELAINHRTLGYLERGDYQPTLGLAFEISTYFGLPLGAVFSDRPMRPLSQEAFGEGDGLDARDE